jgi:very-short-patch-repair endonuclease
MPDATRIQRNRCSKSEWRPWDEVIAQLAHRQHGVVGRRQLMDAGAAAHVIQHRIRTGRLHAIHQGVYAVGHRILTNRGRWMAATLAAGPSAVLSHRAAGALLGIRSFEGLEVTATAYKARPGITVHTSSLSDDEVTAVDGIPVTGVSRTLLDLAAVLRPHQLAQAINEVEVQGLTDVLSVDDLLVRYPRRPGGPVIRAILETGPAMTQSELEALFLAFIRRHRLPEPVVNVLVRGFQCDFVWRDHRVMVELDGHSFHRSRAAFERDRGRDRALHADGWRVIRVTWRQLHEDPEALAADLRKMLAWTRPRSARARGAGP